MKLEGAETCACEVPAGNTRWLPAAADKLWSETYALALPAQLKSGDYALKLKLRSREAARDVLLPLKAGLLDKDGFYTIGRVRVGARP